MPVIAYHWPKVSPPGHHHGGAQGAQGRGHQGLHGRHRADAGDARLLPPADLRRQRLGRGLRRACWGCTGAILAAANIEPELCADAFAGSVAAQKDLLFAHRIVSHYGVKGIKEELARKFGTSTVCR